VQITKKIGNCKRFQLQMYSFFSSYVELTLSLLELLIKINKL